MAVVQMRLLRLLATVFALDEKSRIFRRKDESRTPATDHRCGRLRDVEWMAGDQSRKESLHSSKSPVQYCNLKLNCLKFLQVLMSYHALCS
jgi:hypothetical protein